MSDKSDNWADEYPQGNDPPAKTEASTQCFQNTNKQYINKYNYTQEIILHIT